MIWAWAGTKGLNMSRTVRVYANVLDVVLVVNVEGVGLILRHEDIPDLRGQLDAMFPPEPVVGTSIDWAGERWEIAVDTPINWEARRWQIATNIMLARASLETTNLQDAATAVRAADALIARYRAEPNGGGA